LASDWQACDWQAWESGRSQPVLEKQRLAATSNAAISIAGPPKAPGSQKRLKIYHPYGGCAQACRLQ